MLWFNEGFTFRNFLADAIAIFVFVVTFWLLITVFMTYSGVMIFRAGARRAGS